METPKHTFDRVESLLQSHDSLYGDIEDPEHHYFDGYYDAAYRCGKDKRLEGISLYEMGYADGLGDNDE